LTRELTCFGKVMVTLSSAVLPAAIGTISHSVA
jgi:hypothetical protein